jgi:hypothetical protein
MEVNDHKPQLRSNPIFVISISIVVALLMLTISFLKYYNSDTRRTVEQIQLNNQKLIKDEKTHSVVVGQLDKQSIEALGKDITTKILSHSTESDYSVDDLTDSALGL